MSALVTPAEQFSELYISHHGWLHGWLQRKLGCREGAADLAQDTFLRLLSSQPAAALREPRAYLSTIANGLVINHWRRQAVERAYLDALAALPEPVARSPEERAVVIEMLCQIEAVLEKLAPKARQAFLWSQLDGWTYAQIAAELKVSERMVKKYMAQAMLQCALAIES